MVFKNQIQLNSLIFGTCVLEYNVNHAKEAAKDSKFENLPLYISILWLQQSGFKIKEMEEAGFLAILCGFIKKTLNRIEAIILSKLEYNDPYLLHTYIYIEMSLMFKDRRDIPQFYIISLDSFFLIY